MHLVGVKRIQQALWEPNVLERFISDKETANKIRATFVDQYSFNVGLNFKKNPLIRKFHNSSLILIQL